MRRKISLYIADRLVDLDNQSLVLLNYTMEDMANPAIVKNSYSQQITIKGTPNNNKIFGDIYRSDRVTQYGSDQTGIYFDPTRKTPFKIFNELGEVLESGYCKLDKFTRDKEYTISLFGGLGAFFYALSYDEQGNKRSLADLVYLHKSGTRVVDCTDTCTSGFMSPAGSVSESTTYVYTQNIPVESGETATFASNARFLTAFKNGVADSALGGQYFNSYQVPDGVTEIVVTFSASAQKQVTIVNTSDPDAELNFTINRDAIFAAWSRLSSGTDGGSLELIRHYDNKYEDATGMTHDSLGNQFNIYDAAGTRVVALSGVSSPDFPLAICIGQYGAILGTIGTGTRSYHDYKVNLPNGTYTIRVNGNTSVAPMANHAVLTSSIWDIINFAPAYNGLPTGSFDANKALINAQNAGLALPAGSSTTGGYVLVNLPQKYTEWETKDLRSYLQRPVIKISKIIDAICNPANNGGYQVNLDSDFFKAENPYYGKTWLTLPIIQSLNLQETGGSGLLNPTLRMINIPGGGNITTLYNVNLEISPRLGVSASGNLYMDSRETNGQGYYMNYIKYTAKACDSQGNVIETQEVLMSTRQSPITEEDIPRMDIVGVFGTDGEWIGNPATFSFSQTGISYIDLSQDIIALRWGSNPSHEPTIYLAWFSQTSYNSNVQIQVYGRSYVAANNTYRYTSSSSARTGATITKADLLTSDKTPADYLLGFTKMFGLVYHFDKVEKIITISQRKNFYQNNVIDLTRRVNLSKTPSFLPFGFDSKWYNFGVAYNDGEYATYYAKVYGRRFGLQKVNTGYGFNAASKEILSDIAYNGAVQILESSKNYVDIIKGAYYIPSVFQDGGATYSVSKGSTTEEVNVPPLGEFAQKTWLNPSNKTFDLFSKPQFHKEENAPVDERDTILFFDSMKSLIGVSSRYAVTDDNLVMMTLNNNTPCWILDYQLIDNISLVTELPMFSRYLMEDDQITHSLDLGTPLEIAIPGTTFQDGSSIYDRYWKSYIMDRYDDDSKVMTCKVNLSGLQVNEDLFRSFYYYDGAIWALNKIVNHSLTTYDDTECEFVKVQNITNYTE